MGFSWVQSSLFRMRLEVMDEELGRDNLLGMRSKNIKLDHKAQTPGSDLQVSPSPDTRSQAFNGGGYDGSLVSPRNVSDGCAGQCGCCAQAHALTRCWALGMGWDVGLGQTWTLVNAHGQVGGEVKLSYSMTNLPAEGGGEGRLVPAGGGTTKRRGSVVRSLTGKAGSMEEDEESTLVLRIGAGAGLMRAVADQADKYIVEVCALVTIAYFGVRPPHPTLSLRYHTHTHTCTRAPPTVFIADAAPPECAPAAGVLGVLADGGVDGSGMSVFRRGDAHHHRVRRPVAVHQRKQALHVRLRLLWHRRHHGRARPHRVRLRPT